MSGWNKLVGHDWAVQLLTSAIANERIGHAYLITGAEQIGKTTLARIFAQALNCEAPSQERPCNQCRTCHLIATDHHPDVRFIQPQISERGKHSIKIDQIRLLQQELNLSPYEARTRLAILKRFDTANINAANAFLKTLEEPPSKVVLLLTANDADSLLPTIASRCRTIGLRPLSSALIEESLMIQWGIGADEAQLLSHLAAGRLGWAVQASHNNTILAERQNQLAHLRNTLESNRVRRFALAGKLTGKPESLPALLRTWLSWWHDLALLAFHGDSFVPAVPISNIDQKHQLAEYAHEWNREWILSGFKQTGQAIWQLERNGNVRLVLENLFLSYPLPDKSN